MSCEHTRWHLFLPQEKPFRMVYRIKAVILVEIRDLTFKIANLNLNQNKGNLRTSFYHLRDVALKRKIIVRYNKKVIPHIFQEDDLLLCKASVNGKNNHQGKLAKNWEGPYRVITKNEKWAYILEMLLGERIPCTWKTFNLRKYYN